jgi:hypothetical protein
MKVSSPPTCVRWTRSRLGSCGPIRAGRFLGGVVAGRVWRVAGAGLVSCAGEAQRTGGGVVAVPDKEELQAFFEESGRALAEGDARRVDR